MDETETRKKQGVVLLLVLLLHGFLIEVLIRELKRDRFIKRESSDGLLVYLLGREALVLPAAERSVSASSTNRAFKRTAPIKSETRASATPTIDWQHELELSAQNLLAEDQKEKAYRDLAKSMSPSQLDWLKQHQMKPASPGLTWASPRVEVTKSGMPIVHINDHCVLVPLIPVPMVFCGIGHIEPNGELFERMRDPEPP